MTRTDPPFSIDDDQGRQLDVTDSWESCSTVWSLDSAPTATVSLHDPDRRLIDILGGEFVTVRVGGERYRSVGLAKSGSTLTVTAEHRWAFRLRSREGELTATAGAATRRQFLRRLAADADVPTVRIEDGERGEPDEQFARGDDESSWDATGRIAKDGGLLRYVDIDGLHCVAPATLAAAGTPLELVEFGPGVDRIDFELDAGQRSQTVTVDVRAETFDQVRVGQPVRIRRLTPLAGPWLVTEVTARPGRPKVTLQLGRPRNLRSR